MVAYASKPVAKYGRELMAHDARDDLFQRIAESYGLSYSKNGTAITDTLDVLPMPCYEIRTIYGTYKGKKLSIQDVINEFGVKTPIDWKHVRTSPEKEPEHLPKIVDDMQFMVASSGLHTLFFADDKVVSPPSATLFWIPLGSPFQFLADEKQISHFIETLEILKPHSF